MAKIKLEHPETGEVRETHTARVAVELQAQHGYRLQKDLDKERADERAAQEPEKKKPAEKG
jgi:hypothetical protein